MDGLRLTPEMVDRYTAQGSWGATLLHDYLARHAAERPQREAVVSPARGSEERARLTWRQLGAEVERAAGGMRALGLGTGDVVSIQLPNWYEYLVLALATSRIGGVINGITPIYRQYELRFILERTASKLMVIPAEFRGFDYVGMVRGLRNELPSLRHVVVVGSEPAVGAGFMSYDELLARSPSEADGTTPGIDANDVVQIAFTSGTTGEPKGAMHTHNTLRATGQGLIDQLELQPEQVNLVVSPVGHQTGFLWGLLISLMLGGKMVFCPRWDPVQVVEEIAREGVTTIAGATPFLRDLTYAPNLTPEKVATLRTFITAGAPIPPIVVRDGSARLGKIHAGWGMTEYGLVTALAASDPQEKAEISDGRALPWAEVRVQDADGHLSGPGEEGDLQIRGPGLFVGYYKRPDFNDASFTEDGFLKTGDRAYLDAEGFLRIAGRTKDIIIRGGENIPVVEIEALLYAHPRIQDVAIVAMPDERLGERACAYVVLKPGAGGIDLQEITSFLLGHQVAKQKLPERLELIDVLPRTITGKVQKFQLREDIKQRLAP
ncbi:MAG: AMP-binding protein [Chloroflexi bacterium]|nr:AMP-binding protein [Chloroflexota bacterium]